MIWLTWRQHRFQFLVAVAVLALFTTMLVITGLNIASTYRTSGLPSCFAVPGRDCEGVANLFNDRYHGLRFLVPLFLILPALAGVFWGAPLVAREVEQGTHRLAWTQSVSRTRWAVTKIAALAIGTIAGAAVVAWTVSWWSRPFVTASNDRFSYGIFDLRGIVPVAYALFALAAGIAAGALIRRTVPAMAASIGAYLAVRIGVEFWLRPHYASPRTMTLPFFTANPRAGLGDWVLSTKTLDAAGHVLGPGGGIDLGRLVSQCPGLIPEGGLPDKGAAQACLQRLGVHVTQTYQPGSRYWMFQGIETAIFVVLAVGLVGFTLWFVKRRLA
jgi:hypothetical protein